MWRISTWQILRIVPCRFCYVFSLFFIVLVTYMVLFKSQKTVMQKHFSGDFKTRNSDSWKLFGRFSAQLVALGRSRILPFSSGKAATTPLPRPVNYDLKRPYCWEKKKNVIFCPPLYTELGGKCQYYGSKANCTDLRHVDSRRLRKAQLVIARLLGIFDLIARRHNITYWLSSGTLLGAVRHQGFIPWDDDADIEMTLDQYEKFYRYASRDLPDDVFFQNSESDPPLRPTDPQEYHKLKYKDIGLYERLQNPRLRDVKSCYTYCMHYGCTWHDGLMLDIFVHKSLPNGVHPIKDYLFEGLRLPVASNWKQALNDKLGENFMEIPSKKKIHKEIRTVVEPENSCEELQGKRSRKSGKKLNRNHLNRLQLEKT